MKQAIIILTCLLAFLSNVDYSEAISEEFPVEEENPAISDFLPAPVHTYYCSPSGSNDTGDGTIGNPWLDLRGADGNIVAGDLIYLRAGIYPEYAYVNFSYSENRLQDDGVLGAPIVITNYPGENANFSGNEAWSLTLDGDYQVLLGTDVAGEYGIQIAGGMTIRGDYCRVHNVEFTEGTSNGGDKNPAMIEFIPNTINPVDCVLSHNYFHDDIYLDAYAGEWLAAIRSFQTQNLVIEYNVFHNLDNLFRGAVDFKDQTHSDVVRYNKFINCESGVSYCSQGNNFDGMSIYGNLFSNVGYPIYFSNDLSNNQQINIYQNVVLDVTGAFFYYLNDDNQDWIEHGDIYDNVIDGLAVEPGWSTNSNTTKNLPDFWDHNLWYSSSDRAAPSGWIWPAGYFTHAVTSPESVTYNAFTMTATVADDYAGIGQGRYGGTIGGFVFGSGDTTAPQSPIQLQVW